MNRLTYPFTLESQSRLANVLHAIDQANQADPNRETVDGESLPAAFAYSLHMSHWLYRLTVDAGELAQIACRAQHIERWTMPRSDYPEGRAAYYQWRQACGRYHAERTATIMREHGYPQQDCEQVKAILSKRNIKQDTNTQLMEDAACLVFLERYLEPFYRENTDYDMEKWQRIISRSWQKMSPDGHKLALELLGELPDHLQTLLKDILL